MKRSVYFTERWSADDQLLKIYISNKSNVRYKFLVYEMRECSKLYAPFNTFLIRGLFCSAHWFAAIELPTEMRWENQISVVVCVGCSYISASLPRAKLAKLQNVFWGNRNS